MRREEWDQEPYEEEEWEDEERYHEPEIDWEEEAFYAMTDGMDCDYHSWRESGGDFGSLMDGLGY